MLRTLGMVAFACLAISALGCESPKPENSTSGAGGEPAVATNQHLTGASITRAAENVDVARFADETKLAPSVATLMPSTTRVRKSPGGETIAVLPTGTVVTELSRARDHYLVDLVDPRDRTHHITGWVYKDALESWGPPDELAATGAKAAVCARGELHLQSDHDFCARPCREDGDCQSTAVCDGDGRLVAPVRSEHVRYCVVTGDVGVR